MAVTEQTPIGDAVGNGVTTVFPFSYYIGDEADLVVQRDGVNATLNVDYVVSGAGNPSGGQIAFVTAPANGVKVTHFRDTSLTRATDYQDGGDLQARTVNLDFDRLWLALQEIFSGGKGAPTAIRVPPGETVPALPKASDRALMSLVFDSLGNPVAAVPASGSAADVLVQLLNTSDATKGTALLGWLRALSNAVATTLKKLLGWQNVIAFEFLSSAQVADVQAYTAAVPANTALQNALTQAWGANLDCHIPAGAYNVTGLTQPGNSTYRTRAFRMSGQGSGEIFARGYTGGTILSSTTNAPVLQYVPDVPITGGGNITIDHIRFEGSSTTPVVDLQSFFAQSAYHHNAIHQAGTGDGIKTGWSNTVEIHNNYSINRDWLGTPSLGAARVGAGYRIVQAAEAALTTLRKNTARGFRHGFVIGDSLVGAYSNKVEDFECSYNYNGVLIQPLQRKAQVVGGYMEGLDGGTAVLDQGEYTSIDRNLIFPGYTVGIDSSTSTSTGSTVRDNVLSAGSPAAGAVSLKLGGAGKVASGNTFLFSGTGGALTNVVGLELSGVEPFINWHDNYFQNSWTGGAGTKKINNTTTSLDGTTGYGYIGMGLVENKGKTGTYPALSRGAINLKAEPQALDQITDFVPGVLPEGTLTLSELSVMKVSFTGVRTITAFTAPNLPDKTFTLYITNANVTLKHVPGVLMLSGSANFTPGANGSAHVFQMFPGGLAVEVSRIVF